ncbi:MAG TPA: tetratricopeptide repeat protein [Gammaproteobacteria bacterium]
MLIVGSVGSAAIAAPTPEEQRVIVDSYTLLGDIALEDQRLEEATQHYVDAALASSNPEFAERATRMAHRLALTPLGLEAVARWRELAPDDERALWFSGVLETRSGQVNRAIEDFAALIERAQPDDPGAGLTLVLEALGNEPNPGTATIVMAALVERFPDTPQGHYGLARLALRSGNFDVALANAETAMKLEPDWIDAELLYARALLVAGRTEDSLALAEKLAAEHDELEVRLQYAELLLSAGHGEEAEAKLNDILAANPGLPEATRALAFLALTNEQLDVAEQRFGELRTNERYRDEAFYYLGRIAEMRGDHLQATRSYARVTQGTHAVEAQVRTALITYSQMNDPEGALRHLREFGNANPLFSSEMLLAQGQLLLQMGRREEAVDLLDGAVAASPADVALRASHVELYRELTQDAVDRKNLDEAEQWLTEGLDRYPGDVTLRYSQALLLQEQGRLRKSATVLEALVDEHPDDPTFLNALGYLLTDRFDRHSEARGYIQRALAMEPDSPAIIDSMGWVLYKLGDYEAALDYLERAYRLFDDPEVAAHLIDTRWALGQHDAALELLNTALAAAPDDPHLQEVKQRLAQ